MLVGQVLVTGIIYKQFKQLPKETFWSCLTVIIYFNPERES